jgi:hypothetical protein
MARMQRSLFAQLNALAEEISQNAEKVAALKQAAPVPADPGGYQGASSHPSAHVDNDVQKATTGSRASEYEADVKKQQGALAVDNTPEMSQEGRQDQVQLNIGTNAAATGEDAAAEKDYKGTKDDPGTSHPAKANDGEKYSSVTFKQAHSQCSTLGNEILADLINFGGEDLDEKKAGDMPDFIQKKIDAKKGEPKSESKGELKGDQDKLDTDGDGKIEGSDLAALRAGKKAEAFAAGYELAAAMGLDKAAAEASVRDVCANTLREADEMADLFVGFYTAKVAAADPTEEASEGEDHGAPSDVGSGEGGEGEPATEEPAAPEEMMGGGAQAPGLDSAPPSEEEALQELAMALQELGIPPEALLQGLGGAGGGMPPEAGGGMPPEAAGAMPPEMSGGPKMAAAQELQMIGKSVINFQHSGNFQIKEARTKRSRELRDTMKGYVRELLSR